MNFKSLFGNIAFSGIVLLFSILFFQNCSPVHFQELNVASQVDSSALPEPQLPSPPVGGANCSGTAPLYSGNIDTGTYRDVVTDPSHPGQCMCTGGLVYDKDMDRCQKACPVGTHFNDRNGVYTCDSCKDAIISERNGTFVLTGVLISNTKDGNICVYPGHTEEVYDDPSNGSSCYIRLAFVGWPSGIPTAEQFNMNSYPAYGGSSCSFQLVNAQKAYMWNCSRTVVRAGVCPGMGGGMGMSPGVSGGGINSQPL